MGRGRPKGSKDTKKRHRRPMTEHAKQARRDKKSQCQGQCNQQSESAVMPFNLFTHHPAPSDEPTATHDTVDVAVDTGRHAVTFSDNSSNLSITERRPIVASLDLDDDDGYDGHSEDNFDADENASEDEVVQRKGIQQLFLERVHARLKLECNAQHEKESDDWILGHLTNNNWWIRQLNAPEMAKKLSLKQNHLSYYRDIRVWIPELQYGMECMPSCPCCKSNKKVTVHGFQSNHYGRTVIGLKQNYYIISRRYRCEGCRERNEALKRSVSRAFSGEMEADIEQNIKYTFMGWNERSLPLLPRSLSEEFPAFLTHKSGVDKTVIDLMRPLIDSGVRPERISDIHKRA